MTRFDGATVSTETVGKLVDTLNGFADRDDVAELVDWQLTPANRSKQIHVVVEYREADD